MTADCYPWQVISRWILASLEPVGGFISDELLGESPLKMETSMRMRTEARERLNFVVQNIKEEPENQKWLGQASASSDEVWKERGVM